MIDHTGDMNWDSLDLAMAQVTNRRAIAVRQPTTDGPEGAEGQEAVVPPPRAATLLMDE